MNFRPFRRFSSSIFNLVRLKQFFANCCRTGFDKQGGVDLFLNPFPVNDSDFVCLLKYLLMTCVRTILLSGFSVRLTFTQSHLSYSSLYHRLQTRPQRIRDFTGIISKISRIRTSGRSSKDAIFTLADL